jgi:hypothetical protein
MQSSYGSSDKCFDTLLGDPSGSNYESTTVSTSNVFGFITAIAIGGIPSKQFCGSPTDTSTEVDTIANSSIITGITTKGSISKEIQQLRMELSVANAEKFVIMKEKDDLIEQLVKEC